MSACMGGGDDEPRRKGMNEVGSMTMCTIT